MFTHSELVELLHSLLTLPAETELVEFKKAENSFSDTDLGEYFSALSNEANLKGVERAWLVFGVDNNTHKVLGSNYKPTRPSLDEIKKKVADQTTNRITFDEIYEVKYEERRVVMFQIPAAPLGLPIAYKGHYYGRDGESLVALNLHEIELIRSQANARADWSAEVIAGAGIDDLDSKAIAVARENYANKHEYLREEMKGWTDMEFLNRAKITRNGRITNTAIILLGKPESEVLISPAVSKLRWILKDSMGVERDYLIKSCPMILSVDEIFSRIRNLKYRHINPSLLTLFPDEMDTYEPYVIREAMNNAIAHQDYSKGGMINIVEYEDRLVFSNKGSFIPGTVQKVLENDAPEEIYHNRFLAAAMVELKMVDTIGSGIRKMFGFQRQRLFPMPDYSFDDEKVKVTIIGKVLDLKYADMLAKNTSLSLSVIEMLNRVQLGRKLTDAEIKCLRNKGLVEGRKNALTISKPLAQKVGQIASYTLNKGFDDEYYRDLIVKALKQHGSISRKDVEALPIKKLPDVLDEKQKLNKIGNLLTQLRVAGIICVGEKKRWVLK